MGKSTPLLMSLPESALRSMSPQKPNRLGRRTKGRPRHPQFRRHRHHRQRRRQRLSPARRNPFVRRGPCSPAAREQLLADICQLQSPDEAADWVHKNLSLKNTLTVADADLVETGFRERLATIESAPITGEEASQSTPKQGSAPSAEEPFLASMGDPTERPTIPPRAATVRRRRVVAKTIRLRDKEHYRYIATQPCVVCGRTPSEAHSSRNFNAADNPHAGLHDESAFAGLALSRRSANGAFGAISLSSSSSRP